MNENRVREIAREEFGSALEKTLPTILAGVLPGAIHEYRTRPLQVKIAELRTIENQSPMPTRQTPGSAGYDVMYFPPQGLKIGQVRKRGFATINANEIILHPNSAVRLPCGFAVEVPLGYEMQIRPRSSLAEKGVLVQNSPGTIDQDFRGEVCVSLWNASAANVTIARCERIAQIVFAAVEEADFEQVTEDELSKTERAEGGFGSTGK